MSALPDLRVVRPATLADAAALLAGQAAARLLGGGTDLLPNLRRGLEQPALLVDVSALRNGYAAIQLEADGALVLGGGVTLAALAADESVAREAPALAEAARAVAGPAHRSAATLAGNLCQDTRCIYYNQSAWWRESNRYCLKRGGDTCHVAPQGSRCHAAFCSDLAPVLLALGADVVLQSLRGERRLPLQDLYRDDGAAHLTLAPDELLARAHVPPASGACRYAKARVRASIDFPLAAVAVSLKQTDGRVERLRIGVAGTNSHPLLLAGTDELVDRPLDDDALKRVGKLVQQQTSPMRSTVTPSNYRRQVASVLAQRLLRELPQR
jgi:4-hydroxybenzoyl-CoA reductase subunit beta